MWPQTTICLFVFGKVGGLSHRKMLVSISKDIDACKLRREILDYIYKH